VSLCRVTNTQGQPFSHFFIASLAAHTGQLLVKKHLDLNTKVKTETQRLHKFGVTPLFVFVLNEPAEWNGLPFS